MFRGVWGEGNVTSSWLKNFGHDLFFVDFTFREREREREMLETELSRLAIIINIQRRNRGYNTCT